MSTPQPESLCSVSHNWCALSTWEMVEIFHTTFSAIASVLPNEDVAATAKEYSEFFNAAVTVSLVAVNDRWSVYLVSFDLFGAHWLAVRVYYATAIDLDALSPADAKELEIPGHDRILSFPLPPRAWVAPQQF